MDGHCAAARSSAQMTPSAPLQFVSDGVAADELLTPLQTTGTGMGPTLTMLGTPSLAFMPGAGLPCAGTPTAPQSSSHTLAATCGAGSGGVARQLTTPQRLPAATGITPATRSTFGDPGSRHGQDMSDSDLVSALPDAMRARLLVAEAEAVLAVNGGRDGRLRLQETTEPSPADAAQVAQRASRLGGATRPASALVPVASAAAATPESAPVPWKDPQAILQRVKALARVRHRLRAAMWAASCTGDTLSNCAADTPRPGSGGSEGAQAPPGPVTQPTPQCMQSCVLERLSAASAAPARAQDGAAATPTRRLRRSKAGEAAKAAGGTPAPLEAAGPLVPGRHAVLAKLQGVLCGQAPDVTAVVGAESCGGGGGSGVRVGRFLKGCASPARGAVPTTSLWPCADCADTEADVCKAEDPQEAPPSPLLPPTASAGGLKRTRRQLNCPSVAEGDSHSPSKVARVEGKRPVVFVYPAVGAKGQTCMAQVQWEGSA